MLVKVAPGDKYEPQNWVIVASGNNSLLPTAHQASIRSNDYCQMTPGKIFSEIIIIKISPKCFWKSCCRDLCVYAPSQWEMTLYSNVISHWLGAYTKWSLVVGKMLLIFFGFRCINNAILQLWDACYSTRPHCRNVFFESHWIIYHHTHAKIKF